MTESKLQWESLDERRAGPVRYYAAGTGDPVVLVHGLGGWAGNWRAVAPLLARRHRVLVPDLPGHGGSGPLPDRSGRSLRPYVDAVLSVLEAEGEASAAWVGHSLGGLLGLHAAVDRPEAVRSLVLAAAPGISSSSKLAEGALTVLGVVRPGRIVGRRSARASASPLLRTVLFGWWAVADPRGLDPDAAKAFLDGPPQHTDTLTAGRALVVSDPRLELDRVTCPCLCLWGACDNWVPLADGMEYARRLRAPLRAIADCGHLLIGERPAAAADAIERFLLAPS